MRDLSTCRGGPERRIEVGRRVDGRMLFGCSLASSSISPSHLQPQKDLRLSGSSQCGPPPLLSLRTSDTFPSGVSLFEELLLLSSAGVSTTLLPRELFISRNSVLPNEHQQQQPCWEFPSGFLPTGPETGHLATEKDLSLRLSSSSNNEGRDREEGSSNKR